MAKGGAAGRIVESDVPNRLDRLPGPAGTR